MADPLFQTRPDDVAPAYLARREQHQDDEDLGFLLAGTAGDAQAAPAGSLGKAIVKEVPPTLAKQGVDDAVEGADGWSMENVLDTAGRGVVDFAKGTFVESPRAVAGGVRDAGQELLEATHSLAEWLNENVADLGKVIIDGDGIRRESGTEGTEITLPDLEDPETVTGGLYKEVAQFITAFIPALRLTRMARVGDGVGTGATRAMAAAGRVIPRAGQLADKVGRGAGKFAEASVAGAIADATAFDPHEERLADLVQSYPSFQNPVAAYLASDPGDSEAEARFKRALEGFGLGALVEGFGATLRTLRANRLTRKAGQVADKVASTDNAVGVRQDIPPAAGAEAIEEGSEEALPSLGNNSDELVTIIDEKTSRDVLDKLGSPTPERLRSHNPIEIVPLKEPRFQNTPMKEARKLALEAGIDSSAGIRGPHKNIDTGATIDVSRKGIEKTISGTESRVDLELVGLLPDLIKKAVLVESRASTRGKETITGIHRFYSAASFDGSIYRVKITARQTQQGSKFYNLESVELEGRPGAVVGGDTSGPQSTTRSPGQPGAVKVEELLEGVNRDTDGRPVLDDIRAGDHFTAKVNLAKIDEPEDVTEAIRTIANRFSGTIDDARRGQVSNAETAELASDLGLTVEELLSRRQGQAFNAEEALAARQVLASSGKQLVALARKAATVDASPADVVAFRRALSIHTSIQAQVSGMTAEAGRALQSFKIMARGASDRDRQIREMIEGNGGDLFNRDMAHKLANIAHENPAQLSRVARKMSQVNGWEQMYEVWVNGLLSGPQTHAVNVLSNSLVALWQVPERFLASQIGRAFGDGGVQAGEATAQAFGMVQGFKDGLKLAAKALRTGEGSDVIGKVEQSYRSFTAENFTPTKAGRVVNFVTAGSLERGGIAARGVDLLGDVVRVPSRLLTAEDELFKAIGYRMELQAQAFRTASTEGLDGEDMAQRIADIVANPPENLHLAAVDAARYQTFTKPLGDTGQAAQKWIRTVPALRLVAPFVRTPTNILKYVGERTPLAALSKSVRADIAAGGARRDLALARIGLGTMVMGVAADMTASGMMTGGGPSDPKMKAILHNTGWQPYAVKVGDIYYSYNRLDPLGMTLGLAADTAEIMGQTYGEGDTGDTETGETDSLAMAAVLSVARNVTSKTWLTGISDLVEAISDRSPAKLERFIQRYAGTLVPTGLAQANRTFSDPILRDTKGLDLWQSMVNQIHSRIPGYSDGLPPRTNVWGDPIVLGGGMGPDIVSPLYTSTGKASPADQELLRLGIPITMPQRQIKGVKLTAHEYHRYVVLAGNEFKDPSTRLGLKDTIDKLVDGTHPLSSTYKRASDGKDGGKALLIKRLVTGFREQAKIQLMQEIPELRDLVEDQQRKRGS